MNKSKEKILIVYAGRYGSTAEVAKSIEQELGQCRAAVDVRPAKDITEISSYDAVIVGSAIYYGKWLPEAVKFMETHKEVLSRIPVAYFLTCLELTKVPEEKCRDASIYLDPLLGNPPRVEGKLSMWEKGHLLSAFMDSVLKKVPLVKPVSIGVFKGKLDYSELSFTHWLLMKLIWLFYKRAPEGDFRNWEVIRSWAASLCSAVLNKKEEK